MSQLAISTGEEAVPVSKDMEGVNESFKSARDGPSTSRQKKIAVLTSGGDSAGMNAAGKLNSISLCLAIDR